MDNNPRFRYIDASHVEGTTQDLAGFNVLTATGRKLGELDGLIVDPPERRIRYLVVDRGKLFRQRRLLVPMSSVRLDVDHRALLVDLESGTECPDFEERAFPAFSDEDVLSALFRRSSAIH